MNKIITINTLIQKNELRIECWWRSLACFWIRVDAFPGSNFLKMEARENVFVQIEQRRPNVIYHKACVGTSLAKELYLLSHITCMESLEIELVPSIPLHSMKMGRKGWVSCMFSTSSLCTKAVRWWNITKTQIDNINTKFLIKIAKHLWLPLTYSLNTMLSSWLAIGLWGRWRESSF